MALDLDNQNFIRSIEINWSVIDKDSYLRKIPALARLKKLKFPNPVTIFSGENGTGKSTLLEGIAIASGFNPEGGNKFYNFSTYDSHSELFKAITISKLFSPKWGYFLRAESFYNVATKERDYGSGREFHDMSHGQAFLSVINRDIDSKGLYILDEPEAALSPQHQLTLLIRMKEAT